MSITLTPDLEQFVQKEVATGRYSSPDEAVCAAVRLMRDRKLEDLRAAIDLADAQVAAGKCTTLNDEEELRRFMEEIKAEGRRRLQSEQAG